MWYIQSNNPDEPWVSVYQSYTKKVEEVQNSQYNYWDYILSKYGDCWKSNLVHDMFTQRCYNPKSFNFEFLNYKFDDPALFSYFENYANSLQNLTTFMDFSHRFCLIEKLGECWQTMVAKYMNGLQIPNKNEQEIDDVKKLEKNIIKLIKILSNLQYKSAKIGNLKDTGFEFIYEQCPYSIFDIVLHSDSWELIFNCLTVYQDLMYNSDLFQMIIRKSSNSDVTPIVEFYQVIYNLVMQNCLNWIIDFPKWFNENSRKALFLIKKDTDFLITEQYANDMTNNDENNLINIRQEADNNKNINKQSTYTLFHNLLEKKFTRKDYYSSIKNINTTICAFLEFKFMREVEENIINKKYFQLVLILCFNLIQQSKNNFIRDFHNLTKGQPQQKKTNTLTSLIDYVILQFDDESDNNNTFLDMMKIALNLHNRIPDFIVSQYSQDNQVKLDQLIDKFFNFIKQSNVTDKNVNTFKDGSQMHIIFSNFIKIVNSINTKRKQLKLQCFKKHKVNCKQISDMVLDLMDKAAQDIDYLVIKFDLINNINISLLNIVKNFQSIFFTRIQNIYNFILNYIINNPIYENQRDIIKILISSFILNKIYIDPQQTIPLFFSNLFETDLFENILIQLNKGSLNCAHFFIQIAQRLDHFQDKIKNYVDSRNLRALMMKAFIVIHQDFNINTEIVYYFCSKNLITQSLDIEQNQNKKDQSFAFSMYLLYQLFCAGNSRNKLIEYTNKIKTETRNFIQQGLLLFIQQIKIQYQQDYNDLVVKQPIKVKKYTDILINSKYCMLFNNFQILVQHIFQYLYITQNAILTELDKQLIDQVMEINSILYNPFVKSFKKINNTFHNFNSSINLMIYYDIYYMHSDMKTYYIKYIFNELMQLIDFQNKGEGFINLCKQNWQQLKNQSEFNKNVDNQQNFQFWEKWKRIELISLMVKRFLKSTDNIEQQYYLNFLQDSFLPVVSEIQILINNLMQSICQLEDTSQSMNIQEQFQMLTNQIKQQRPIFNVLKLLRYLGIIPSNKKKEDLFWKLQDIVMMNIENLNNIFDSFYNNEQENNAHKTIKIRFHMKFIINQTVKLVNQLNSIRSEQKSKFKYVKLTFISNQFIEFYNKVIDLFQKYNYKTLEGQSTFINNLYNDFEIINKEILIQFNFLISHLNDEESIEFLNNITDKMITFFDQFILNINQYSFLRNSNKNFDELLDLIKYMLNQFKPEVILKESIKVSFNKLINCIFSKIITFYNKIQLQEQTQLQNICTLIEIIINHNKLNANNEQQLLEVFNKQKALLLCLNQEQSEVQSIQQQDQQPELHMLISKSPYYFNKLLFLQLLTKQIQSPQLHTFIFEQCRFLLLQVQENHNFQENCNLLYESTIINTIWNKIYTQGKLILKDQPEKIDDLYNIIIFFLNCMQNGYNYFIKEDDINQLLKKVCQLLVSIAIMDSSFRKRIINDNVITLLNKFQITGFLNKQDCIGNIFALIKVLIIDESLAQASAEIKLQNIFYNDQNQQFYNVLNDIQKVDYNFFKSYQTEGIKVLLKRCKLEIQKDKDENQVQLTLNQPQKLIHKYVYQNYIDTLLNDLIEKSLESNVIDTYLSQNSQIKKYSFFCFDIIFRMLVIIAIEYPAFLEIFNKKLTSNQIDKLKKFILNNQMDSNKLTDQITYLQAIQTFYIPTTLGIFNNWYIRLIKVPQPIIQDPNNQQSFIKSEIEIIINVFYQLLEQLQEYVNGEEIFKNLRKMMTFNNILLLLANIIQQMTTFPSINVIDYCQQLLSLLFKLWDKKKQNKSNLFILRYLQIDTYVATLYKVYVRLSIKKVYDNKYNSYNSIKYVYYFYQELRMLENVLQYNFTFTNLPQQSDTNQTISLEDQELNKNQSQLKPLLSEQSISSSNLSEQLDEKQNIIEEKKIENIIENSNNLNSNQSPQLIQSASQNQFYNISYNEELLNAIQNEFNFTNKVKIIQTVNFKYQDFDSLDQLYTIFPMSETSFTFPKWVRTDFITTLNNKNYNQHQFNQSSNQQLIQFIEQSHAECVKAVGLNLTTKIEKELIDLEQNQKKVEDKSHSHFFTFIKKYMQNQEECINKQQNKQQIQQEEEKKDSQQDKQVSQDKQNSNLKDKESEKLKKKKDLMNNIKTKLKEETKKISEQTQQQVKQQNEQVEINSQQQTEQQKQTFIKLLQQLSFDDRIIQFFEDKNCLDMNDVEKFRSTLIKSLQDKNQKDFKCLTEQLSLLRDKLYFDVGPQTFDTIQEYDYKIMDQIINFKENNNKLKLISKSGYNLQFNQFDKMLFSQKNESIDMMKPDISQFKKSNKKKLKNVFQDVYQQILMEVKKQDNQNNVCIFLTKELQYDKSIEQKFSYQFFQQMPCVSDIVIENLFALLYETTDDQDLSNSSYTFRRDDFYLIMVLLHNPYNLERIMEMLAFIINNPNLSQLPIESFNKPIIIQNQSLTTNQISSLSNNFQSKCLKILDNIIIKNRGYVYLFLNLEEMGKKKYKMEVLNQMADLLKEKHVPSYDISSCFKYLKINPTVQSAIKQQTTTQFQYNIFNEIIQQYIQTYEDNFNGGMLKSKYFTMENSIKDNIQKQFNNTIQQHILEIYSLSFYYNLLSSSRINALKTNLQEQPYQYYCILEKVLFNLDEKMGIIKWLELIIQNINLGQWINKMKLFINELKQTIQIELAKNQSNLRDLDKKNRETLRTLLVVLIDKYIQGISQYSEKIFYLIKYLRKVFKWSLQCRIRSLIKQPFYKIYLNLHEQERQLKKLMNDMLIECGGQDSLLQFYYESLRCIFFMQEFLCQGISPLSSSNARFFELINQFYYIIKSFFVLYNFNMHLYCPIQQISGSDEKLILQNLEEEDLPQDLPSLNMAHISSSYSIDGQQKQQKQLQGFSNFEQDLPDLKLNRKSISTELPQLSDFNFEELEKQLFKMDNVIGYFMKYDSKNTLLFQHMILKDDNIKLLPLEIKAFFISNYNVQRLVKDKQRSRTEISMHIDRNNFLDCSLQQFLQLSNTDKIIGKLNVQYNQEQGIDQGGLSREWITTLIQILMDPRFGLFKYSANNFSMIPNPFSFIIPNNLLYYKFLGNILGKAFQDNFVINVNFARSFLKLFKKKKLYIQDLEDIDPEFYKGISFILENNIDDMDLNLNFSYYLTFADKVYNAELIENGENIKVTEQNKKQYIKEYCKAKMIREIQFQNNAIQQGFYEIVNQKYIDLIDEVELGYIFSGAPTIDIQELKKYINLQGSYTLQTPLIIWFFEILESFTQVERSALIFFISGTMNLPLGGFKHFTITINYIANQNKLPVAHTCSMTIDLPSYSTKEILEQRLRLAIFDSKGFEIG